MLDRINAPSSCKCLSWKVSIVEREAWAMQKLFIKEKESIGKNGQVSEIFKTMGTQMPAWKKEMNKITPVLLQMFLGFKKRDMFSRSIVEWG